MTEISCSTVEQEKSVIVAHTSSSDVNDVISKEKNNDYDQSSSSSIYSSKPTERKLITRIFPPLVEWYQKFEEMIDTSTLSSNQVNDHAHSSNNKDNKYDNNDKDDDNDTEDNNN
ncbi:hypothetical protein PGT21_018623 [Puccinia graminis f. sp. tritici]|uniref:Uncharacterized protein n=1 Tax=Puccinia graminis f. sp. tritici TaxID=56615 RepID=A0A5B0NAP6_PUCGR|nr:hypothetical protein PGT21_018623 [Puccinia graminis f. sp. tritici]KAA1136167.1 hypothetical protein PGTUg99_034180 [Puccinia graminis f. sp. tritici]